MFRFAALGRGCGCRCAGDVSLGLRGSLPRLFGEWVARSHFGGAYGVAFWLEGRRNAEAWWGGLILGSVGEDQIGLQARNGLLIWRMKPIDNPSFFALGLEEVSIRVLSACSVVILARL